MRQCFTRSINDNELKHVCRYYLKQKFQIFVKYVTIFFRTFKHRFINVDDVSLVD